MQKTDCYAVIGNPVRHSRSPRIHQLFAQQFGHAIDYQAVQLEQEELLSWVYGFFEAGGKGLNVTVPFKQQAFALAQVRSDRALCAQAVNTLLRGKDGRLYGDTTDGVGLLRDLQRQGCSPEGRAVLLLGAGGAARSVLEPLIQAKPGYLAIANRTVAKARELAEMMAHRCAVGVFSFEQLPECPQRWDLVINATSASLGHQVPDLPEHLWSSAGVAYDMVYAAEPTAFLRFAASCGVSKTIDGLGMLVEQAAESFFLWRGQRPSVEPVIASLRQEMNA